MISKPELWPTRNGKPRGAGHGMKSPPPKPGRLPGYHESQLASTRLRMFSPAPIYHGMEIARVTGALELDIKGAGKDEPFVQTALNGKSPAEAAAALVNGTKVADPAFRKKLVEGGEAAVAASDDPMVVLARKLDPIRREMIKWMQDNVQSIEQQAGEKLGKARFAAYGKNNYPDATFTLRLSFGQMKGYPMNGTQAPPKTTYCGLCDRAAGFDFKPPFNLPARYADAKQKLDLNMPLNFVTTNDIIGGNSGSPVINREGEIAGLIFDGNIESLVGLVKEISSIQRIPLLGNKPGIANHMPQLFLSSLMMSTRSRNYVLLNHHAAHIITAKAKPQLASLQSRSHPGTLNIQNIVQKNPGNRERFQILHRGSFFLDKPPQRS